MSLDKIKAQFPGDSDVYILFNTNEYTLIPKPLYDDSNKSSYIRNTIDLADREGLSLIKDEITRYELVVLSALPNTMLKLGKEIFPEAKFFGPLTYLDSHSWPVDPSFVHCIIHSGRIQIIAVHNDNLSLANTYDYQNEADVLYYILLVYDQIGLNVEEVALYVSELENKEMNFKEFARNYVSTVKDPNDVELDATYDVKHPAEMFHAILCE